MIVWTDTHCHLNHPDFGCDAVQVWKRAREANVHRAIVVGYDLASSESALQIAAQLDGCWASVGIHPHDAAQCDENALRRLQRLAAQPAVVAVGEIGLDYYRDFSPQEAQWRAFEVQLQLASQLQLPVIIHCRDAYDDLLNMLSRYSLRGVLHCFSGEPRHAQRAVEMGWYLGVGGIVTFKNAHTLREVVQRTPLENLLLETDSPYLAPAPHRGKRNEPAYIPLVAQMVASLKNVSLQELAAATTRNADRLFSLGERCR